MEKFWIKYENVDSPANGQTFLVKEIQGQDYHYFIADGGSHVGGGRLLRKYCTKIVTTGESL